MEEAQFPLYEFSMYNSVILDSNTEYVPHQTIVDVMSIMLSMLTAQTVYRLTVTWLATGQANDVTRPRYQQ